MDNLKKDNELKTISEISDRIDSLRRRANELCDRPCKNNSSIAFQKKQSQIAKFNHRADVLHNVRAKMIKLQREASLNNCLDAFLSE